MSSQITNYYLKEVRDLSVIPDTAPLFGSAKWIRVLTEVMNLDVRILLVYKGETFIAWLPFQHIEKGPVTKADPLPLSLNGGPFYAVEPRAALRDEWSRQRAVTTVILDYLKEHYTMVYLMLNNADLRPAQASGWELHPRVDVFAGGIPAFDYPEVIEEPSYADYSQSTRRKIRKSVKAGAEVVMNPETDVELWLQAFNRLHERRNIPVRWSPELLWKLRKRLHEEGLMQTFCAVVDDLEYGWLDVLVDPQYKAVFSLHIYVVGEGEDLEIHSLLYDAMIEYAREKSMVCDLLGGGAPGVFEFKERFATHRTIRHDFEWIRPGLRTLTGLQRRWRRLS